MNTPISIEQQRTIKNAFSDLLDLVVSDAHFENRDTEPYKYDAICEDILDRACAALKLL